MSFFNLFKPKKAAPTANLAKERLQLVIAHQKSEISAALSPEQLAQMQREVLAVVAKYVNIKDEDLSLKTVQEDGMSMIELSVCFDGKAGEVLPSSGASSAKVAQSEGQSAPAGLALG